MLKPDKTDFMDSDMLALWQVMRAEDLPGYILYGGTALALYLNHRKSTDFDFFRKNNVLKNNLVKVPWLKDARFRGEQKMVDATLPALKRELTINFLSIEDFSVIPPTQAPIKAGNGINVAHPIDILANKLFALTNRKLSRDFIDIACANEHMPAPLNEAIIIYLNDPMTNDLTPMDLAKSLNNYSFEVEYELIGSFKDSLRRLAKTLRKHNTLEDFVQSIA